MNTGYQQSFLLTLTSNTLHISNIIVIAISKNTWKTMHVCLIQFDKLLKIICHLGNNKIVELLQINSFKMSNYWNRCLIQPNKTRNLKLQLHLVFFDISFFLFLFLFCFQICRSVKHKNYKTDKWKIFVSNDIWKINIVMKDLSSLWGQSFKEIIYSSF